MRATLKFALLGFTTMAEESSILTQNVKLEDKTLEAMDTNKGKEDHLFDGTYKLFVASKIDKNMPE